MSKSTKKVGAYKVHLQTGLVVLTPKQIDEIEKEAAETAASQGWIKIGEVAIDTAQIMLCDPITGGYNQDDVNNTDTGWATQANLGKAVVLSTGLGDGLYNVEARVQDLPVYGKRIVEIRMVFIGLGSMYPLVNLAEGTDAVAMIPRIPGKSNPKAKKRESNKK